MKFCLLLLATVAWGGSLQPRSYVPDGHPPPDGHPCETAYDCPRASCWDAECHGPGSDATATTSVTDGTGECVYERQPVEECCLNDDECCEFAGEHEIGYCSKTCKCRFFPALQFQCTRDDHCHGLLSAALCRNISSCHVPYCDHGFCECFNSTAFDADGDGVACPDDCDDANPHVSVLVTCRPDGDDDNWPACYDDTCRQFCVEPMHTCPSGWTEAGNPLRFVCRRSEYYSPRQGLPCSGQDIDDWDDACDCCDNDNRAYPSSPYASHHNNLCGEADYNCDGETDRLACCHEAHLPYFTTIGSSSSSSSSPSSSSTSEWTGVSSSDPYRSVWYYQQCELLTDEDDACGGCSTVEQEPVFTSGWSCQEDCSSKRKRSIGEISEFHGETADCPAACHGDCDCVEEGGSVPETGACAKRVVGCVDVGGGLYSDQTECCIVTIR